MSLKKGVSVEVSSDEEGFSGAWFPATILRKIGSVFLVEFRDLMTDDEKSKLKEKVKAHLIRPEPPALNRQCFFLNEEVDAYDQDGWWKGVVDGILPQNKYVIYFGQTLEKLEYDITKLRLHQDWIDGKWVSSSENVGIKEPNPKFSLLSVRNVENMASKSVKRSNKTNENQNEVKVSEFSGECKADMQCETWNDGSSQLTKKSSKRTKKSSKRKQGTNDQSNNGSACRRKILTEENMDGTETQDENLHNIPVKVAKIASLKDLSSPTESENTITISIPYLEIVDQKICHPGNTSEIRGKATLKQMYLLAYHFVLKALYLQGTHNWKLETLLTDLREVLHISNEEHANELRCIMSGQYN